MLSYPYSIVVVLATLVAGIASGEQSKAPDGTYRWRTKTGQGEDLSFEYRPKQISPSIASRVERHGIDYIYAYEISNGQSAKDAVIGCFVEVTHPVSSDRVVPKDWVQVGPRPSLPRVGWFVESMDGGIDPGRSVTGFILRSPNWPGPMVAKCNGLTTSSEEPEWLSADAKATLRELQARELVELKVLAPAIIVDSARPLALAYAAVVRSYRPEITASEISNKAALVGALDRLRASSTAGQDSLILERLIKELLPMTAVGTFTQSSSELMRGLRICLETLLDLQQRPR